MNLCEIPSHTFSILQGSKSTASLDALDWPDLAMEQVEDARVAAMIKIYYPVKTKSGVYAV